MNNISFDNPWLLLIALPLFAVIIIPFAITVRKENANFHNITALCLNLVICACLTLVIAGMTFEKVMTETNVYVLADISYSSNNNLDEVQENVEKIYKKLPKNSKMGVICFGRNCQQISDLGRAVPDVTTADKVDRSATDIASALRYANSLFDDGVIKRIIVITDGAETVKNNSIVKVVNNLQDDDVYVDAVYLDSNLPDDVKEVQIDAVEAASSTYVGKNEEVNVLIHANCGQSDDGKARINGEVFLYDSNGGIVGDKSTPVPLFTGLNAVSITLPTDKEGTFEYSVEVRVGAGEDSSPYNNTGFFTQKVTGDKKVLYLGGENKDIEAGRKLYGTKDVTYFTKAQKINIPITLEVLCEYDEFVLCNFDVRDWPSSTLFLGNLSSLVKDYGKTVVTYGNTYVQEYKNGENSTNNSALKALKELLPVNIGNREQDSRLVTLVLDISMSMGMNSKLDPAKSVAKEIVLNALKPTDTVMIISYAYDNYVMLAPTLNKRPAPIIEAIDNLVLDNHSFLGSALETTYNEMSKLRYRDRQVIIISDGLKTTDTSKSIECAQNLASSNIAISAIGIYPKPADRTFLKTQLVDNNNSSGRGFYLEIEDEKLIKDKIASLNDEIAENFVEKSCPVVLKLPTDDVLEGVDKLGDIKNFWRNWTKPSANAVVTASYEVSKVDIDDVPIYAYWNGGGGNGKVVSFLADITDTASGWMNGTGWDKLLENLPNATLPSERINTPFAVEVQREGNDTVINVKASSLIKADAKFEVTLTSPDGLINIKQLTYNSGDYFATFSTDAPGTYTVNLEYTDDKLHYETETFFSVSYYAEYDSFSTFSKASLYRLISENGNILELDEINRLENTDSYYQTYIFDFTMPLMIVCAVLFVVGVIIRQLKWKDITSFFSFSRRRK